MSRIEEDTKRLQLKLELSEQVYDIAKTRLTGEDKGWELEKERGIAEMYSLVMQYSAGDPSDKAVFILGKMHMIVRRLQQPALIVAEYESDKQLYNRRLAEANEARIVGKGDH